MQMTLLHDRSKSIDVQIRKHQTRLHNVEMKRLQHGADEKSLEELVSDNTQISNMNAPL
jgi:hypothetical protein